MSRRKQDDVVAADPFASLKGNGSIAEMSPWTGAHPDRLHAAMVAVSALGDAMLLGVTSDGGAATILIFHGQLKKRLYCGSDEDLNDTLDSITKWAEAAL